MIKILLMLLLATALVSCQETVPEADLVEVEVVVVSFDEETGQGDYQTYVQFPDGERRMRFGEWGKVGDRFKARKVRRGTQYWQ